MEISSLYGKAVSSYSPRLRSYPGYMDFHISTLLGILPGGEIIPDLLLLRFCLAFPFYSLST